MDIQSSREVGSGSTRPRLDPAELQSVVERAVVHIDRSEVHLERATTILKTIEKANAALQQRFWWLFALAGLQVVATLTILGILVQSH